METIKEALTFDDVLLIPKYSDVIPLNTNIFLQLTKNISLKVPFMSSAMDTVTESKMAIAIAKEGGMGIIHRNLNIKKQCIEVLKVKKSKLLVGAAVGTSKQDLERAKALIGVGVDLIVIDTAHGHSKKVLKTLNDIKKIASNTSICVGNIATGEAAKKLLSRNNATYNEINIATVDGAMDEMIKKANGKRTIPQIFFNDQHIGGYDEVRALEKENKLQDLLK